MGCIIRHVRLIIISFIIISFFLILVLLILTSCLPRVIRPAREPLHHIG
jgi:hypothetical protein